MNVIELAESIFTTLIKNQELEALKGTRKQKNLARLAHSLAVEFIREKERRYPLPAWATGESKSKTE